MTKSHDLDRREHSSAQENMQCKDGHTEQNCSAQVLPSAEMPFQIVLQCLIVNYIHNYITSVSELQYM